MGQPEITDEVALHSAVCEVSYGLRLSAEYNTVQLSAAWTDTKGQGRSRGQEGYDGSDDDLGDDYANPGSGCRQQ